MKIEIFVRLSFRDLEECSPLDWIVSTCHDIVLSLKTIHLILSVARSILVSENGLTALVDDNDVARGAFHRRRHIEVHAALDGLVVCRAV